MFSSITGPLIALLAFSQYAAASCEPPVAFLPPRLDSTSLESAFTNISSKLNYFFSTPAFAKSSVSIQISSSDETLWSAYHTAKKNGNGTTKIDGDSVYRNASNTKIFTALAVLKQHAEGRIDLDGPVAQYVPGLNVSGGGNVDWSAISVRDVMSHVSGLQDNSGPLAVLGAAGASALGLPPVSEEVVASLPACEFNTLLPCDAEGLVDQLSAAQPVFPPHTQSSYSNAGYGLLGLAIENVTGMTYEDYITSYILEPLKLKSTTFTAPSSKTGAILVVENQWSDNLGVGNPAGGLYTSSNDMITFLRYILTNYNTISPTINWFQPLTYSTGSHSFLGAPWEIFRTTEILPQTNRPVTIITKGGGLDGHYSYSILVLDYNLAVSILLAGELSALNPLLEYITIPLIRGVEDLAQQDLKDRYAGSYAAQNLNSSLVLTQSTTQSLHVESWISNGTNVLVPLTEFVAAQAGLGDNIYYQLIPTFEMRQGRRGTGEVWRIINVLDTDAQSGKDSGIWNDYCISNFDLVSYGGKPLTEVVFWMDRDVVKEVELSAFGVVMGREWGWSNLGGVAIHGCLAEVFDLDLSFINLLHVDMVIKE